MAAPARTILQIETGRHRRLRIHRMHDGERNHDGARPRRHLVDEVAGSSIISGGMEGVCRADKGRTG